MLRCLLIYWLAALLLAGCSGGIEQKAVPAVWVVRATGTTIYLTGTVHLLPDDVNWRNGPIVAAIADADELVTELSPGQLARVGSVAERYTRGDAIIQPRERFDLDLRDDYAALEGDELPVVEAMAALDDWALALMLARVSADQADLSAANGMDSALIAEFASAGKARLGLETPEDQFAAFDAIPLPEQRRMLNRLMRDMAEGRADDRLRATVAAWSRGDMEALAAIVARDAAAAPSAHHLLLADRNRKWAQWIKQRLERPGTVLVAVGAGHLAGPDSLLSLLAAQGLQVERLQ
jgi:uncharacterized protein